MLHLSKRFHQKIRQHAIVIAVIILHLLIYRTFSYYSSFQNSFVLLLLCCKDR